MITMMMRMTPKSFDLNIENEKEKEITCCTDSVLTDHLFSYLFDSFFMVFIFL